MNAAVASGALWQARLLAASDPSGRGGDVSPLTDYAVGGPLTMRIHGLVALGLLFSWPVAGCGRDAFEPGLASSEDEADGDGGVGVDARADARVDASRPDATRPDAFLPDTGRPDSGRPDSGRPDAFVPDSGRPDASRPDAVVPDLGFPDAFVPDIGPPDTGLFPDAFVPDVFVPDTGRPDGFVPDTGPDGGVDAGPDGGPITCAGGCGALDTMCSVGVCGPDGVTCVARPRPPGTPCDDQDPCSFNDFCLLGTCFSNTRLDCSGLDDACNVGVCDPSGRCRADPRPPPAGDTCAAPIGLMIAPGGQSQAGSNLCAQDDVAPRCAAAGGRDIVFAATFTETRRVRLETIAPMSGAAFDTAIYINRGVCASPMNLECNDDFASVGFSLIDAVLSGGTYFFVVDGANAMSVGDFELDVRVDPHDTCADPSVLPLPMLGQTLSVRGNTSGNANDFVGSCAFGSAAPDQVYRLEVPQDTSLRLEMVAPGVGAAFDTVLHVRSSTCAGMVASFACDDDGGAGNLSMIERTFPRGTYFVIVDGFGGAAAGEYRLDVTQLARVTTSTTVFPEVGDARQPLMGPFTSAGQFVEGIRFFPALPTAARLDANVQVINALTCGIANFRVRVNNVDVGQFQVRPGMTTVTQSFIFGAITGPNGRYNIRYELIGNIPMPCGSVTLPNSVSTVGLGT